MKSDSENPLPSEQLNLVAEENLVTHMSWVQSRVAGMRVIADKHLMMIDSGLACDTFNFVVRARLDEATLQERIAQAIAFFKGVQRPFSWWVGATDQPARLGQALLDAGLEAAESEVAMVADLDALMMTDLTPQGLQIERVTTLQQLRDFARINAANWQPPDQDVIRFYEAAAPVLLAEDSALRMYVGYHGDEAVVTSQLTVSNEAVGLYNIATLAAHRRKGYGSAMTLYPLLEARAQGFKTAVLQASADGLGVYHRLGFRATGRFTEYQLPE